jgi:uncharacterized membrane protein YeiH
MGGVFFSLLCAFFLWNGAHTLRDSADLASTFVFGFTGALLTEESFKNQPFVVAAIAAIIGGCLTAVGGGTVRTLIMGLDHLFWLDTPDYLLAAGLGVSAALLLAKHLSRQSQAHWNAADRMALAVFAPIGADHAFLMNFDPATTYLHAVFYGFLTGAGGGLLRDLMSLRLPVAIFTAYGCVAALGAAIHVPLQWTGIPGAWLVSGVLTYLLAEHLQAIDFRSAISDKMSKLVTKA